MIAPVYAEPDSPLLWRQLLLDNYHSDTPGNWSLLYENNRMIPVFRIALPEDYLYENLAVLVKLAAEESLELENQLEKSMEAKE